MRRRNAIARIQIKTRVPVPLFGVAEYKLNAPSPDERFRPFRWSGTGSFRFAYDPQGVRCPVVFPSTLTRIRHDIVAGIRDVTGQHADQIFRLPARGTGPVGGAPVRVTRRRRGVRGAHVVRVAVRARGRRAEVQTLAGVAPGEPNADRPTGRRADGARAHTQGDEHVLQFADGHRGRRAAERRPVRPAGRSARGRLVVRHRFGIGRLRRRRRRQWPTTANRLK